MDYSTTKEWFAMSPGARYRLVRRRIRYLKMLADIASYTPYEPGIIAVCAKELLAFGK